MSQKKNCKPFLVLKLVSSDCNFCQIGENEKKILETCLSLLVADCTAVSRPAAVSSATKPLVANIFAKHKNYYIFGTKPLVAKDNRYHIFYTKTLLANMFAKNNHYYTFGTKPLVAKDNKDPFFIIFMKQKL